MLKLLKVILYMLLGCALWSGITSGIFGDGTARTIIYYGGCFCWIHYIRRYYYSQAGEDY